MQHLAVGSNAVSRFVHSDVTPDNPLGWPGLWPTLQPYASWDPSIKATNVVIEIPAPPKRPTPAHDDDHAD